MKKIGILWRFIQWGLLLAASVLLGGIIAIIVLFDVMTFPALIMIGVGLFLVGVLFGAGLGLASVLSENEELQEELENLQERIGEAYYSDSESEDDDDFRDENTEAIRVVYRNPDQSPRTPFFGVGDNFTPRTPIASQQQVGGRIPPPNTPTSSPATRRSPRVPPLPLGQLSSNSQGNLTPSAPRGVGPGNSYTEPSIPQRLSHRLTTRSSSMSQLPSVRSQLPAEDKFTADTRLGEWAKKEKEKKKKTQANNSSSITSQRDDDDSMVQVELKTPRGKK